MEHDFWNKKWESGQIGFHEAETHPMLSRHWDGFRLAAGSRVFVPLCGKSNDMRWLRARGHDVVGIELSAIAVAAFFEENGIEADRSEQGPFIAYRTPGYELLCGDYFDLTGQVLGGVDAVYDRAALIALSPEQRGQYVAHLTALLDPGTPILLVTVRFESELISPPPFHVEDDEVKTLYAPSCSITRLGTAPALLKGNPCEEAAYCIMLKEDRG